MGRRSARRNRAGTCGRWGCVLAVPLLLAVACIRSQANEDASGLGNLEVGNGDPAPDVDGNRLGAAEPPAPTAVPRQSAVHFGPVGATSSAASIPVGDADLWLGARDRSGAVVVWPGPLDAPGALAGSSGILSHIEPDALGRVLDLCVSEEAHAAIRGTVLEPGEPMDHEALIWVRNAQAGLGCHGEPRSEDAGGRWFYLTPGGSSGFFEARDQAQHWRRDQRSKHRNTLPPWAFPMGFINNSEFGIVYSDADDPIDEVRVLIDTVAVRDGVLRGLVRNWSRSLWAYGMTVTAGDKSWRWPLSVQPGEVAPFEIEYWDGPDEAEQIDLAVTARMSPKADISRSYDWHNWNPRPPLSLAEAEQLEQDYGHEPGIVRLVGGFREMGSTADFRVPASHPSFARHIQSDGAGGLASVGAVFTADDLVSYLAYLDWQIPTGGTHSDGSAVVFEVVELPVFWPLDHLNVIVTWFGSDELSEIAWLGISHDRTSAQPDSPS